MDQAWMMKLSPHAKKVLDDLENAEFTETVPPMSDADRVAWEEIRLAWKAHLDGPDAPSAERDLKRREIEEWRARAHEKLRALSEDERRQVLASVDGTLAVEGMALDAESREALLSYARGDLSADDFDTWLLRRAWLGNATRGCPQLPDPALCPGRRILVGFFVIPDRTRDEFAGRRSA